MLLAACGGGHASPSTATPAPQASASAPAATATVTGPRTITGMFTEPRPSPADETRQLGPLPETFQVWNGNSTMVYDMQTNKEIDLGPGSLGRFSPDSTRMAWIASPKPPFGTGELWIIDLRTQQKQDLGAGRLATFIDDQHVSVAIDNNSETIDLTSHVRTRVAGLPAFQPSNETQTPDGYVLRSSGFDPGKDNSFSLTDPRTGAVLLQFEASAAVPAGKGTLAVATTGILTGPAGPNGYRHATTNVFLIDIKTAKATFVATGSVYVQFTLVADDGYVVWTDNYCDGGHTRIYDRRNKKITEVDATLWPAAMAGGLILDGPFGGRALIDPATLRYRAALPPGVGDTSWSPDHRYASLGQYGGHGGLCM